MSRCYPYPPAGYQKKAAQPVPEIIPAAPVLQKEKRKHKDKDKDKEKKKKRKGSSKDDNSRKEKRSTKKQKANDLVATVQENGRLPPPSNAAAADNGQGGGGVGGGIAGGDGGKSRGKSDKSSVIVEAQASVTGFRVERDTTGKGGGGVGGGREADLYEAGISSSERETGKAGSRISIPSSSGSSGKAEVQELRTTASCAVKAAATVRREASAAGKDDFQEEIAAPAPVSGREARSSAKLQGSSRGGVQELRASVSTGKLQVSRGGSSNAQEARPFGLTGKLQEARTSSLGVAGIQEAKTLGSTRKAQENSRTGLENRKEEGKKRDEGSLASYDKEINGKVLPAPIVAKPVQAQLQQVPEQQQQQQAKSSKEMDDWSPVKLPEVPQLNADDEELDWLLARNKITTREKKSEEEEGGLRVWAEAVYLPSAEMYALPYVVPY